MTKRELATRIAEQTKVTVNEAVAMIDAQLAAIKEAMSKGESLYLRGFGTFKVIQRKAKIGQVIKRREAIHIPARLTPKFVPCKTFKNLVNTQPDNE